jgi:outer membrane protein assembly factor BamB
MIDVLVTLSAVSMLRLAIDYGTSNTVAMLAWPDGRIRPLLFGGMPLLPSAVFAEADGRLLVGTDAVHAARSAPAYFEATPKRRVDDLEVLLGDRAYPVEDLVAAVLRAVAVEATRVAGAPPAQVVLTYPAAWGPARQRVLREAAARAGLPAPALVTEPVAASVYFATVLGRRVPPGSAIVVYDLGAGTFDVSVVRTGPHGLDTLASGGLADVGGADLDQAVIEMVGQAVAGRGDDPEAVAAWRRLTRPDNTADLRHRLTLRTDARLAKEALSRRSSVNVVVPLLDRDVIVDREEFERRIRPLVERTATTTLDTIRAARVPADRLAGLFLVGGCSRVPLVGTVLHRITGIAPTVLEQPELVVAEGALHAPPAVEARAVEAPARQPPAAEPPVVEPPVVEAPAAEPAGTGPAAKPAPEPAGKRAPEPVAERAGVGRRRVLLGLGAGLAAVAGGSAWLIGTRGGRGQAAGSGHSSAVSTPSGSAGVGAGPSQTPARQRPSGPPGTLLWRRPAGSTAAASPVVAGDTLYAASLDHHVYALDVETGQQRWQFPTGNTVYGGPVVAAGLVYVGSNDGKVYALRADGTLAWSKATTGQPGYLSPVTDGRVYLVTSGAHGTSDRIGEAYALDAATGQELWHAHVSIQANAITVAGGVAYVSSFDKRFYAFRVGSSTPLWTAPTGDFVRREAVVDSGTVYFASIDRSVYALDAATGSRRWKRDTGQLIYSAPVLAGGRLFVGTQNGSVLALAAADGTPAWNTTVGGAVNCNVAVADGVVYVGTQKELVVLDASTGHGRWRATVGSTKRTATSRPYVADGVVYVGNGDGYAGSAVGEVFAFVA